MIWTLAWIWILHNTTLAQRWNGLELYAGVVAFVVLLLAVFNELLTPSFGEPLYWCCS